MKKTFIISILLMVFVIPLFALDYAQAWKTFPDSTKQGIVIGVVKGMTASLEVISEEGGNSVFLAAFVSAAKQMTVDQIVLLLNTRYAETINPEEPWEYAIISVVLKYRT